MDLSDPKLRKILVGVAVFIVILFIIIHFFRRSRYSYPNTTEQNEYDIQSIVAGAAATATTPASVTVTTKTPSGIKVGELVFLYGFTGGGTLSGTKSVTNIPPGVTAPAEAIAVYVLTASGSTFTIEGTVAGTISGGKVQTIGYQPMTTMMNTNTQCQNQYAFELLDNTLTPKVFTPTGTPQTLSSSSRSLNLASSMVFAQGDRATVVGANDSTGPAFLIVDQASTGTSVTFTAASIAALLNGSATILPQSPVANVTKPYNNRQACISASATTYTLSHCKYLPPADGTRPLIPTAADDPAAAAAYSSYTTAINTIQKQYAPALTRAQNGTFPAGNPTSTGGQYSGGNLSTPQKIDIVTAARKADLAGATRKYLATVCPGFYAPGDPTQPDPTDTYKTWTVSTGASKPTTGLGFWYASDATASGTGGVPDADIMKWAQNAGIVTYSGSVSGVTVTNGGSGYANGAQVTFTGGGGKDAAGTAVVTNGALTGITITNGGSGYTSAPSVSVSGGTGAQMTVNLSQALNASAGMITSGSFTPSGGSAVPYTADRYSKGPVGNENWRIAYYNGPGTYPTPNYAA